MTKHHPEHTLRGKLERMTEDRDFLMNEVQKYRERANMLENALKAKEERFVSYKAKVDRALNWHRALIENLVAKLPGGKS